MNRSIGPIFLAALLFLAAGYYLGFMTHSYDALLVSFKEEQKLAETYRRELSEAEEKINLQNTQINDLKRELWAAQESSSSGIGGLPIVRLGVVPENPIAAIAVLIVMFGILVVSIYALARAPFSSPRRSQQDPNERVTVTMKRSDLAAYNRYLQQSGRGTS